MKIDAAVVDLPVEEGARTVSLALLATCDEAASRLEAGEDDEALHDFRVALRRLRTVLRSFRRSLRSSVSRSKEKRLRRIARDTNRARDAEVELAWLGSQRGALSPRHRKGVDLLARRLAARARGDCGEGDRVVRGYRRVSGKLAKRLRAHERKAGVTGGDVPFGAALARSVTQELARLCQGLAAIRSPADRRAIHRARILGKRLRYLLELVQDTRSRAAAESVRRLKGLQDILGAIHDSHVVARTIARARGEARAGARDGLLELDRRARDQRDALFARLEAEWRDGDVTALAGRVRAIASSLEARAGGRLERASHESLARTRRAPRSAKPLAPRQETASS
jgi:CHAD domain-containing protein